MHVSKVKTRSAGWSGLWAVADWTGPDPRLQQYPVVVGSIGVWRLEKRCTCSTSFLLESVWTRSSFLLLLLPWVQIGLKGWALRYGLFCIPWWPWPWVISVLESPTGARPAWQSHLLLGCSYAGHIYQPFGYSGLLCMCGSQTVAAYSKTGLTRVLYDFPLWIWNWCWCSSFHKA